LEENSGIVFHGVSRVDSHLFLLSTTYILWKATLSSVTGQCCHLLSMLQTIYCILHCYCPVAYSYITKASNLIQKLRIWSVGNAHLIEGSSRYG